MTIAALWIDRAGLILGFIGSLLIALSVGKPPFEAFQDVGRRKVSFAALTRPWALYWGVGLLGLGFALSFIATFR